MFPGDITQVNSILSTKTSIVQGLFIEMFFTAELVFVVLMLAMEKSKDTFLAPIGIGFTLFVTMLSGMFAEVSFPCEAGSFAVPSPPADVSAASYQGPSSLGRR